MKRPIYLPPWDLLMLSVHYIQKGHLPNTLPRLPHCRIPLSVEPCPLPHALPLIPTRLPPRHFRIPTRRQLLIVSLDCVNSPGARLIHAAPSVELLERSINDKFSFNFAW
ncbi:unnamed protein product [Linum trigynum]|uniref:Uncharacterized protein n=1 Tax=Linum trigynum TaxID=586398 RepID=A0AAV2CXK3_9ROSI